MSNPRNKPMSALPSWVKTLEEPASKEACMENAAQAKKVMWERVKKFHQDDMAGALFVQMVERIQDKSDRVGQVISTLALVMFTELVSENYDEIMQICGVTPGQPTNDSQPMRVGSLVKPNDAACGRGKVLASGLHRAIWCEMGSLNRSATREANDRKPTPGRYKSGVYHPRPKPNSGLTVILRYRLRMTVMI